jgi:Raf kinase inhibitor-like YbhB/YbcL family protein
MRRIFVLIFAIVGIAASVYATDGQTVTLLLQSPAFAANGNIPGPYTCEGQDISPPLGWSGIPAGTKSFALIVDDPDAPDPAAPKRTWVHWVIYNIPATVLSLPEGAALPAGTGEGPNDWGTPGWRGPCPPVGRHRYFFKLYALNAIFAPQQPLDKAALEMAMFGHVLAQAELIGTYEHSKH